MEKPLIPRRKIRVNWLVILMALLVLGFGVAAVYFMQRTQTQQTQVEHLEEEKVDLNSEIETLEKQIELMEGELTTSQKDKTLLQKELKDMQDKIGYYKVQVNKLMQEQKLTVEEKEKYKGKYEQLEYYNERYREKINDLQKQIEALQVENQTIKDDLGKKEVELANQGNVITRQNIKIEAGSQLTATSFAFSGIYSRGKEKETSRNGELKVKKMEILKVCCKIARNTIADAGDKELYMQVVAGSGRVYQSLATVSGYFKMDGREEVYSAKTKFQYGNADQEVCVQYAPAAGDPGFEKGVHKIIFYSKIKTAGGQEYAYVVGHQTLRLK